MPANSDRDRRQGDEWLLGVLAQGRSVREAAEEAQLSERTVYRRLASPSFQGRLVALRDELVTGALGELVGSASEAVATLKRLLQARDERVQLGAARALLDQLLRLRETVLLEQRIRALERNVELAKRRSGR